MTDPQGAEALIRRLRHHADSLEAAAEWFTECKVLRLERLPTGFIAALRAGAEMLRAAALSGGARPQEPAFDYVKKLQQAKTVVRSNVSWKRFIDGTPLENDIAVWMTDMAAECVRDAAGARPSEPADALRAVAQSLVDFQTLYEEMTWDTLPGNSHYAGMLMKIVEAARSALGESR